MVACLLLPPPRPFLPRWSPWEELQVATESHITFGWFACCVPLRRRREGERRSLLTTWLYPDQVAIIHRVAGFSQNPRLSGGIHWLVWIKVAVPCWIIYEEISDGNPKNASIQSPEETRCVKTGCEKILEQNVGQMNFFPPHHPFPWSSGWHNWNNLWLPSLKPFWKQPVL